MTGWKLVAWTALTMGWWITGVSHRAIADELSMQHTVCQRTLEALAVGDANEAENADDEASESKLTPEQRAASVAIIQSNIDLITKVGAGLPSTKKDVDDAAYNDGWLTIREWTFPNRILGYAGCARSRGGDGKWTSFFRMDTSLDGLRETLRAAIKRKD